MNVYKIASAGWFHRNSLVYGSSAAAINTDLTTSPSSGTEHEELRTFQQHEHGAGEPYYRTVRTERFGSPNSQAAAGAPLPD